MPARGAAMAVGRSRRWPSLILLPFLVCAALDYVLRVNNAMIAPQLVAEFGLGPAELGFVTSAFFVAFALAQLPLGLALDRFGPRPVISALLSVGFLGGLVYVSTGSVTGLAAGRFLMGIGMSGSLMGGIKAGRLWFPASRLPQITGALVALTGIGGMLATGPMAELLRFAGWRQVFAGLLALLLVTLLSCLALVPAQERGAEPPARLGRQLLDYCAIFTSFHFWRYGPLAIVGIGVAIAYQTLWAPLWLRDVAGFDARGQAWTLFLMFVCIAVGNFVFGSLCRRCLTAGRTILPLIIAGMALSVLLQLVLLASRGQLAPAPLWAAISILFACPIAIYAVVSQGFPAALAARAASALNALVFVAVFASQALTGAVIELFPRSPTGDYAPEGHLLSLALVTLLQALALAWCGLAPRFRRVGRR